LPVEGVDNRMAEKMDSQLGEHTSENIPVDRKDIIA